jgi:hypothetical protein
MHGERQYRSSKNLLYSVGSFGQSSELYRLEIALFVVREINNSCRCISVVIGARSRRGFNIDRQLIMANCDIDW